jgi:acetoin utilization deacetylase AcuC-like enzyme
MGHLLITHPAMADHGVPPGHPERPARLAAALVGARVHGWAELEAPEATDEQLARVHPWPYLRAMAEAFPQPGEGLVALDSGDTFLDPGSRQAAYLAAGAVVAGVDAVLNGEAETAFAIVRPPGHHAEPAQPMGFCVFNNIAVGALHALEGHGLDRVAVLDFDVHHGNGTQAVADKDPRLFFASTHGSPLYPGTGFSEEAGRFGTVANWPLPPGTDGTVWRRLMAREVFPAIAAFQPQLLLVSAGFDAHAEDPLAPLALQDEDYAWVGEEIARLSLHVCKGRVVSSLEGGYSLDALTRSVTAYAGGLMRGMLS